MATPDPAAPDAPRDPDGDLDDVVTYRLAPLLAARLMGSYLVALALVMLVLTAVVAATDLPPDLLVVPLVLGVVGVFWLGTRLRRAWVLRLDATGYAVRMVRGARVREARWSQVQQVATSSPRGVPCLVLTLGSGESTVIPVQAVDHDREDLVREVQRRLGARPGGPTAGPTGR